MADGEQERLSGRREYGAAMTRAGTVVLLLVLGMVSLGAVGVTVAAADASTHTHAVTPEAVTGTQTDVDPDRVLLRAAVQADGTAAWTVEYRVRLDDENATDAFESVAAEIRNDSSPYTERFTDRMQGTVSGAADATGRCSSGSCCRCSPAARSSAVCPPRW